MAAILIQCLFLVVWFVQLDCEVYEDRPKIKSLDGNLIIRPALDKNIYLTPNGPRSNIYVGNVNLLNVIYSNASVDRQSYNDYQTIPQDSSDILRRLQVLETLTRNWPNITVLSRRVNRLNNRVSTLQAIINRQKRDECESQSCLHGGTCLNLVNGYYCLCPSNWEGKNCDIDVNECRNFAGTDLGCQNGATCINKPGTYECSCRNGWFGLHCTRKAKDCLEGDFEMCGHGTCIKTDTGEGIKCICNQGWTTNSTGVTCLTDVNECDLSQGSRCSINPKVDCINLPGSFRCGRCPPGYDGDGFACYDIDECVTIPNGGCSTSPMVSCHNTIGSRVCGPCPPGYEGDGVTCTWVGSCALDHGRCHPSARCVDSSTIGSLQVAQCICPEGMIGNGIGIHGCYVPVTNNITQRCEGNPCGPNGQCHPLRTGYTCICFNGYRGAHCDTRDNVCMSNPCLNGGTCKLDVVSVTGFRCECTALYSGLFCQVHSKPCGGVLHADEGSIVYPTSNTTYNHNARCAWVIHTTQDKVINVTFSKFNLEDDSDCQYDFLQIHDGRSSASQLIGRFCGSTYPKGGNIVSSHNNLYFWFRSDRTVAKEGFALHWTSITPICGGEVDATTHGHISSPGSPGKYPPNRDCYWHLTTTLGKRIQLHFFTLDIENHANCSFDYLAIYDGEHVTDPLLEKFCNSTQPAPIQSSSSEVLIHFHSDSFGAGNGFQIAFAPADGVPGCGGYFTTDRGEIVSPSFDNKYLNNLLCEYKIKTGPDTKIRIEFKNFKLERSFRCRYDFLKVYDGPSSDSPLVGKYCSDNYPKTYTSSSNTLFLVFRTDHSMASEGFKITYESICHKTIVGDSGILKSPGYPFSYPDNKECEYLIQTRPGKSIILTFQDFDIESSHSVNCLYDYIEIRNGFDSKGTLLGKYCGGSDRIPPVQISSYNYMYIRFKSDMSLSGTGFYANYTTVNTRCGGIYRDNSGVINHPPTADETYNNDESCTWILIAPEGMRIMITWQRFSLEQFSSCSGDFVKLIEIDDDMTNNTLGKYCGTTLPPALTTSSNRLIIKFESDINVKDTGFSLSYTFLDQNVHCGGYYVKPQGYIYSPRWPRTYEPNRDCKWTITAPVGQQILLNITDFDLERPIRNKCDLGDYLEIRNGATSTAPLIGKYCGSFAQKLITSMANSIYLHFHSDFYLSGKGFKIMWDGTITGCGGTLTSTSGQISSPNYPDPYNENAECYYRIVVSNGARIRIVFTDLQLERTADCNDDFVEVFDGRDSTSASFGKFCYKTPTLNNIETTSNLAFIKFRSDFLLAAKGFLLNYETICNTNLSGSYGVIESPGFPGTYPSNANCLWTITVSKGSTINITFTHFDIRIPDFFGYHNSFSRRSYRPSFLSHLSTRSCESDYLETKETTDTTFNYKICGSAMPPQIHTKTNSLQIKFVSGANFPRTGFRLEWVKNGCGGHIQKRYGNLKLDKSTILPGEMECEWIIESPIGTSIKLTITELVMVENTNCSTDALEIYNGQSSSSPLITKICHSDYTYASTTGNLMYVKFVKKSSHRNIYFISHFDSSAADCGGRIESRFGMIYSKNYPKNYDSNLDCIWFITVPNNHRIELNIIDLDLYKSDEEEDDSNCNDAIKIYDGSDVITGNYTYRICPTSNLSQIVTSHNNLAIQFITDAYGTAKGFKANFTVACGAVIDALYDGVINNDKYISHSTKNCTWTVVAPKLDEKIKLTITHLSIPQNTISNRRCPSTFLKVFDGSDDSAPLIGEYCGYTIPPMLVSHGNTITIQMGTHTDVMNGHFSAHYSSLTSACGGSLTAEEGDIASPNYPLSYPLNVDCEWILATSPGNRVYITFENFDLEYSEGCNEDYLEVRENNGGGELLGTFCGSNIPTNTTAATKLYIKFHSDNKNAGRGFVAHYGFLHGNDISGLEAGDIASPLYPYYYERSGVYTWRIVTSGSGTISINVDHIEIHQHDEYCNSYLAIYDGYDNDAPVIEKFCGILTNSIQTKNLKTTSSVAFIKLQLDVSNTGSLFHLQWTKSNRDIESIEPNNKINCGSNVTELIPAGGSSYFQSPNYPSDYGNELNCEWDFKAESGRHLRLFFEEFSIEETPTCYADYISIYSSNDPIQWSPIKQHMCTSESSHNYTDSSTYLKVKFKTDTSVSRKGFKSRVESLCGGFINEQSGIVTLTWLDLRNSLNRVNKCYWTVKVRPGRKIMLKFDQFNITNSEKECTTYVVLKNGESSEAPFLGKYCGYVHENRNEIISSGNSVYITYVSPFFLSRTFQNFRLHFEEKNIECGATSSLDSIHTWEVISSPNYPSVPVPYTECVWVFNAPPGEILRIDFVDRFDLQKDDSCSQEYVEIRDGSSEYSQLKGRYCREKPGTVKTSNNYIYIKYVTQLAEPRDGFKANISIDSCGGTILSNNGEILSPSYPDIHLKYGTVCEWHVVSSLRRTIQLHFKDLNLPASESPCATKIEITERVPENNTVTLLKTICDSDVVEDINTIETVTNEAIIKLYIGKPSDYFIKSEYRGFRLTFNSTRPLCGGVITTAEGFLTTPGYPRKTILGYCQWIITVPNEKRRVRLELIDNDVNSQGLSIYNDAHFRTLIQRVSGDETSRIIESTGNKMALYLFVKPVGVLHRFKAKFSSDQEALCGGELNGLTGQLDSPDLNRPYTCEWKYNAVDDSDMHSSLQYKSIYINVKLNATSTRTICRFADSVLNIKASAEKDDIVFSRTLCGNNTDVTYRLPSTSITIKAIENYRSYINFHLEWQRQPCGGIVHIGQNSINIMNIPNNYTGTLECGWILVTPIGIRLEIKLEGSFRLDCSEEYLQISQGLDQFAPIIGDYCRDKMPNHPFSSSFMHTHVQYHSKAQNASTIRVMARTVSDQCGGFLTNYDRIFNSPDYPNGYPDNLECTWEIQADLGNRVSLQFVDRFAIEDTQNCSKDVLIIYDWNKNMFIEIARICGRRLPNVFNSTENRMKVTLRTDDSVHLDGFTAQWDPICGGSYIATEKEQFIYSPGYPYEYPPSLDCVYDITGSGQDIFLKFYDFEFEGIYPECIYDNVTIIGQSPSNYLYDVYCGREVPKPLHNNNRITVKLKTDSYTQKKGFKLGYSIYNCGATVKQPTLITTSAMDTYDNNMNCSWFIEAPLNKIIVMKFLYVDIEKSMECYNDYINVFEGQDIDVTKRIALICGSFNTTRTIRSKSNKALLQFISDSSLSYKGFKIQVLFSYSESVGCGGIVNLTSTSIQTLKSPLINGNILYESYLDCHWEIRAPLNYVVKVNFESFHIAPCENVNQTALGFSNCDCDAVELRDGPNPDSIIIGRYCGHTKPPQLISSRNTLTIILSTDGDINSSGFVASLSAQRSLCGSSSIFVSRKAQRWTSPGYEIGTIPRGLHCTYDLDTSLEPYAIVQITIHNLDLEGTTNGICDKDKLDIIGNSNQRNISLGQNYIINESDDDFFTRNYFYDLNFRLPVNFQLCGTKKSMDFYVQGRVSLTLITSPDNAMQSHTGVEIEVIYLGFCGRNYTGTSGRIQSSYGQLEEMEKDCYTLITAPENHTISLYFMNVGPDYSDDNVFLKIYDGNNTNSNLMLTISKEYVDSPVFSTGRYLLLHNHGHGYNLVTYDLNYVTTDKGRGCGGVINNEIGRITSPLYPDVFRKKTTCQWDIYTPVGTKLYLRFNTFDLGRACDQNYVELQDSNGNSVSNYCEEKPADHISTDNFIRILFVTTMNNGGTGWVADFIGVKDGVALSKA